MIAIVVMLAGLPWVARRVFGPPGDGWLARIVLVSGYAAVLRASRGERPRNAGGLGKDNERPS